MVSPGLRLPTSGNARLQHHVHVGHSPRSR
jgi:hypothetical protein